MKVLITGAGAVLGQGMMRSLLESSLKPQLVAVDPSPLAVGLYWTEHRHLVPMASDPRYVERMEQLLDNERPDAVLVGTDVELGLFATRRLDWEARFKTKIVVSDSRVVEIADDKYLTFEFLRSRGFPVPDSCLPAEHANLVERVGFPLIVKPRIGARSVGVRLCRDARELARALEEGGNLVVQECVGTADDEYTAGVLVFDGRCQASIVMRRDLRDGNTFRAYVQPYPELDRQVRALAEALAPYGPANFQFRVDRSGAAKVFEINARFSGTTPFRMRAGMNEVEMVLRHVVLGEPLEQPEIRPMTILRWYTETAIPEGELAT